MMNVEHEKVLVWPEQDLRGSSFSPDKNKKPRKAMNNVIELLGMRVVPISPAKFTKSAEGSPKESMVE